jgi:hypothetical protein
MHNIWGIPRDNLNLRDAQQYIHTYDMSRINGLNLTNDLSDEAKQLIDTYWWNNNYKGYFGNYKVAQLCSSDLVNFIIDNVNAKVEAIDHPSTNTTEFHKNIKHIFFSAHDTTIACLLALLKQQHNQPGNPPLASMTLIELFSRKNVKYISWKIDDVYLKISDYCNIYGECQLEPTLQYLRSLTIADVENECENEGASKSIIFPLWAIITIVVAGIIFIGFFSGA